MGHQILIFQKFKLVYITLGGTKDSGTSICDTVAQIRHFRHDTNEPNID